jgi:DNA-binding NtrC family response regulator
LASKQYDVLEARSGEEALEIAEQHEGHIDLLLTDVVMTGISGKVLSLKLKETRPNVRVVFMSGYTENTISKEGVLDEETMFVAKPFLAEDLLQKIEDALNLPGEASR